MKGGMNGCDEAICQSSSPSTMAVTIHRTSLGMTILPPMGSLAAFGQNDTIVDTNRRLMGVGVSTRESRLHSERKQSCRPALHEKNVRFRFNVEVENQ